MLPNLLLTLLSLAATTFAFTAQSTPGVYQHYLDDNGREVVEKIADISANITSTISKRQSANFPTGTTPTCVDSTLSTDQLYNDIWGVMFDTCGSGYGMFARRNWALSVPASDGIGYFCAYGLNVDCVGIEWGTAVAMTANTCQNAGSGRTQSGYVSIPSWSKAYGYTAANSNFC